MRVIDSAGSFTTVIAFSLGCVLVGCKNDSATKDAVNDTAQPVEGAAVQAAPKVGQSKFDEAAFAVEMASKNPVKVGETGHLTITLTPKAPFHVNAEYPHRFKVTSAKGSNAPATVVTAEPAKRKPTQLELSVPVVPSQIGSGELEGELSFSVCTAEKCLMEKRQLKTAFQGI